LNSSKNRDEIEQPIQMGIATEIQEDYKQKYRQNRSRITDGIEAKYGWNRKLSNTLHVE
jgi:hypothetical protein